MSKIAKYLNGHIIGEISANVNRLNYFSTDRSILKIKPNLVMYPRISADIRKVMRFSWQLAEKNHVIGITARGFGGSTDGSSIGDGIIVDISRHMDKIEELDLRNKTVRVKAGANFSKLNLAIGAHAMTIPQSPAGEMLTVGGAIAQNLPAEKFNYGNLSDVTRELEVVLSSGDLITTRRISKRELSEKLALQTFEGSVYRGIDTLLEENVDLIQTIEDDSSYGYSGITKVKKPDGSFDLTPLFFGSLGTLGIITQATFSTDYIVNEQKFMVISFEIRDDARDFIDEIRKFNPETVEMFDGKMFEAAVASGKKYKFYLDRVAQNLQTKMVVVVGIANRSIRKINSVNSKIKKVASKFSGSSVWVSDESESDNAEIDAIRDVREILRSRAGVIQEQIFPVQGVYIPLERFEEFYLGLQKLAQKFSIPAPIQGSALTSTFEILTEFDFHKVSDRRKSLEFLVELNALLVSVNGIFSYGSGEGQIYGNFIRRSTNEEVNELFDKIRKIFDPMGILNPRTKSKVDSKYLIQNIRNGK